MRKRVLAAILAMMMLVTLLPTSVSAATQMGYPPYANVEYSYSSGVTVGTIRYIAQNSASAYFYSSYWPSSTFGGYAGASTECGTACISMALSYVGVNRTPKVLLESTNGYTSEMWGTQGDATSSSIGISKSAIATAMNNYINGNGKYSPLCIYIQPWSSTSSMHWVLLIGKISENTYLALNPWHTAGTNGTLTMVINGTTATYNGVTNPITSVNQWYNPKAVTDLDTGSSRLKIEPTTIPAGNLTPGAAFSLQGTVSSNYKITNFDGSIIKASGAVQQSVSTTPNAYSVDIRSSNVNQNLVFGDYPNGKYKLHYYAKDASGKEISWDSDWFWIGETVVDNYYLDVNGWLDGASQGSILQYGTFDVNVNGSPAADDVNDYYTQWPQGTAYSINDIRPARGYSYDGVYSGSRTGTVSSDPTRVVLSFSTIDISSITETPTQQVYNGHTYLYYQTPVTWYFAEEFCEAMGGHLVCVTSDGENSFVKALISGNRAWLGATDIDSEGSWRWVSGEQFSYSDWDSGEPNNSTGGENSSEDYAHYNPNKWNDTTGCLTLGFVCEIDYACEHVYNYAVTKEPTKTEAGVLTGYCNLCDETVTITLPKLDTSNYTKSIIPGTCTTRTIERYEWNTKTYGTFSFDVVMGDEYSDWSTDYPTGVDASLIESRTEYRYSDYQTTTSYNSSMSGWTLKSSEWQQSSSGTVNYVPTWPSGFSTSHSLYSQYNNTPKSASETTTDKTVINSTGTAGYIYWHWCRDNQQAYLESMNRLIKPVYSSEFHGFHAFFSTKTPAQLISEGASHDSSDNSYVYRNTDCCKDSEWYFPLEVKSQSYTTYKKLFTYERWTDWSAWSTTVYTASSTRKVETRTLYRYITNQLVDHTWNEGEITTPATCTEDGVKTYTCTACNETRTEAIEMLGHDYDTAVTAPTCTEPGYTTHTCSRCGVSYTDASADATGHNIVNGVCTVCGLSFPVVAVGSVTAAPGETLTVPVTISNNTGFAGFTFVFTADDALTITKIAKGALLQSADSGSFTTNVSGGVVTWFDSVNTTGDGTLMLLTVTVADDAEEGTYSIHTALKDNNETNFVDESSQAIPVSFTDGAITVATPTVDAKLTVYGNPVTATPGSTITVPVLISGGENFAGFTFTISTSEALTLKSIEKGALLKDADGMFTKNIAQKTVNWTCSENLPGDGELMVLTFDVSEAAEDGDLTVSLALKDNKPTNMVDADERPVSTKFEDIIVTVSSVIYGDTNSDGEVDTADAVRLVRYLVDLVELTDTQKKAADVNHDYDLTSADSIRLVRYLVGLVETLDKTSAAQPTRGRTPRQASSGATVDVGTVSGDPGATVAVPVTITGNTGFAGFTLEVSYPEGLTLTKVAKGTLLKESDGGALTSNVSKNLINWNDTENLSGDGQMLVLTFKISDTAESGDYAVSIGPKDGKPGNFVDEEGTPVSATFNPGTVTVNAHEHQYVDVVTAPTCTEQGYTTHTCSVCGGSYVDTYVPALGHDWGEWVLTTPPTATTKGEETRTCNRCGETETRDVDPVKPTVTVADASGNNGDTITVPVSIANNTGFAGFTLEVEYPEGIQLTKVAKGTLLKESDGGALTSNVSKNLINWNDTENLSGDGQMLVLTFKISDTAEPGDYSVSLKLKDGKAGNFVDEEGNPVNAVFEAGTITVAPHEHQYVDVVTAPTCTEQGYTTHTCSICGDTYVDTYVPALGHDWGEWSVTTAPTCTEKGVETRTCSRCNETETRDVAALGHDLIHHDAQAPSCTEIGWNAYDTCSRCDYTTYEELPALGHNPGAAKKENNVEPTCTEAGSYDMVVRCTRCNEILESTHTDVPALGHDWSDWAVTTAPTCTEKGVETRTCSRCNETETRDVAALGHTPAEAVKENNVEPTCTENGGFDMVVYCATCGAELSRTHTDLAALGHDWDDGVIQDAASCTEDGVKLFTCRRCGETRTEVISATGHTPGESAKENEVPATCTTAGSYDMVVRCTVCNAVISTEHFDVAALGHDYQAVVTAPTCTEKGYTTYTCSRCGDAYVSDETAALGHDWSAWTVTTASTCTNTGIETRTCSRCGETESREIAALGHDWDTTTYVWSDDYAQVTATRICKHDANHKEVETAQSTSEVTVEPTVDTEGEIKYTATFTNPAFESQVKVLVLPKLDKPGLPCDGDETCPGKVFTDMPKKGHWAHDAIDWAIVNGVTKGTSDTTFSPNQTCTRAEIVTFLWRAAGSPEPQTSSCAFTDVKAGAYYYRAVLWAAEKGITAGTSDTTFSPNDGCTREQVVTFIWRFAGSPEPTTTTCPFNDVKAGRFSYKAILWAAENGVTAGTSETTFSPQKTCTRAEIVTFLWRHMVK